jgi:hypothetical protein
MIITDDRLRWLSGPNYIGSELGQIAAQLLEAREALRSLLTSHGPARNSPAQEKALAVLAKAFAFVLAIGLAVSFAAPVRAVDVNHVELGSQPTPETLKTQLGIDVPPAARGAHIAAGTYSGFGMLAGAGTEAFVHIDASGTLDEIRIEFTSGIGWSRISPAAIAKWGKPVISTADVSNKFGLALKDEYWVWDFPDHSRATLIHFIDADTGQLDITSETRGPAKGGAL